MQEKKRKEKK